MTIEITELAGAIVEFHDLDAGVVIEVLAPAAAVAGANGKSAYELAVQQGFSGTLDEWLLYLRGYIVLDSPSTPVPDGLPDETVIWERV